jgi:hypothetical protein
MSGINLKDIYFTGKIGVAMIELKVLQAARLKGRVSRNDVAATIDEAPEAVDAAVNAAIDAGHLIEAKTIRVSDDGKARLAELLAAERLGINAATVEAAYDEFRRVNAEFKELVSDWQLKNGQPNSHDDDEYDAAVLARLDDVHQRLTPIIATVATELPRLTNYSVKLQSAREKVRAGETSWLTRPIVDSYHTVWFELHEELILAAGLTREQEARAGHAN